MLCEYLRKIIELINLLILSKLVKMHLHSTMAKIRFSDLYLDSKLGSAIHQDFKLAQEI
jgi:hypothetical protein